MPNEGSVRSIVLTMLFYKCMCMYMFVCLFVYLRANNMPISELSTEQSAQFRSD